MNIALALLLAFAVLAGAAFLFFLTIAVTVTSFNALSLNTAFLAPKLFQVPSIVSKSVVFVVRLSSIYVRYHYL